VSYLYTGIRRPHGPARERRTLSLLADLAGGDGGDRELVLAYARMHMSGDAMERLEKILNKFEARTNAGR
jgi:hypothetical protein